MDKNRRKTDKSVLLNPMHSANPQDYQYLPQRVAVMPKRFPDGFFVEKHSHLRDQLIYAVSGVMRIGTTTDAWVVPPDRALLMPAGVEHSIDMRGHVEMRTLYIKPSKPIDLKVLAITPLLRELISTLASEHMNYSGNLRAEQIAGLIATELTAAEALPLNIPLPSDARLQQVCELLLSDPSNNLSLEELAHETAASSKTLARVCKKELGMNFSAWRRRVRFSHAFELLRDESPMKQIARQCGYESPSAFAFAFRREFEISPSEFREHWPINEK